MAKQTYLIFDGETVPVNTDSYSVEYSDVLSEGSGTTEAGTTIRDIAREGVVSITASFNVTVKWLKKLRAYKKKDSISVDYFDPETGEMDNREMYIDSFKAALSHDTSYKSLWTVSFNLEDISDA